MFNTIYSTDGPDDIEDCLIEKFLERNSKMVKVRYSTVLCTGLPKEDTNKTKFCHLLVNQDTPPPEGDSHKIFIKMKNDSAWTEIDTEQLSTLIDKANKTKESDNHGQVPKNWNAGESECATIPCTVDTDEILDILILVDINVPTPTVSLLPPALVTFVTYKLYCKENHICDETCEFIKELLSSYCFTDTPRFSKLKIKGDFKNDVDTAFIGTLNDDDYKSSEVVYKKEANLVHKRLKNLELCVNCSPQEMPLAFWYLETNRYLHIANLSSTQGKIFENLRDELKKIVEQNSVFQIPITWLLLSLKIQKLFIEKNPQSSEQQYVLYKDIEKIWNAESEMGDESELNIALQFFQYNGVLFHFKAIEGARDCVFANCGWLFDKLKCLLSKTEFKNGINYNAKELLIKEGILKTRMIKDITFRGPEEMTLATFINLLVYLKFIAEVKIKDEYMYFMPSILKSYGSNEQIFDKYGNKCHDALQITFSSGSMHRSVFCFLSAYILNNIPKGWRKLSYDKRKEQQHTFKDLITFSVEGGYYVCIIDNIFSLEVRVYSQSQLCNPELHSCVYRIIKEGLKNVCQSVEIPYTECKYGFMCNECESGDHMMILSDFSDHFDYSANCSQIGHPQSLSDSQRIWFKVRIIFFK